MELLSEYSDFEGEESSGEDSGLVLSWRRDLHTSTSQIRNQKDNPNYYSRQPSSLISTSTITSVSFGTGGDIYRNLQPALESVSHELILVTCFWARSRTLDTFNNILHTLSKKGVQTGRKVRVRICFSSSSLLQKLLHTLSPNGQTYPSKVWVSKLGLPPAEELPGLDLQVQSIFFLPFCVMHPKFIICDRKQVFLPSCNVSWEDWFEGCIGMTGSVVEQFVRFWEKFWASPQDKTIHFPYNEASETGGLDLEHGNDEIGDGSAQQEQSLSLPVKKAMNLPGVKTLFLPSPHHVNPCFRFPWQYFAPAPPTPLNTFLLSAINMARSTIYIQTPNLTSPPVLEALLRVLRKPGIDVCIVTSERLMILEQLVTAGTTTSRCVRKLVRDYTAMVADLAEGARPSPEGAAIRHGTLRIEYFEPRKGVQATGNITEPVQSHLKCMIVDGEVTVLGSGNLDRASWYTSQELGVALFSKRLAVTMAKTLERVLQNRKKLVFDSRDLLRS